MSSILTYACCKSPWLAEAWCSNRPDVHHCSLLKWRIPCPSWSNHNATRPICWWKTPHQIFIVLILTSSTYFSIVINETPPRIMVILCVYHSWHKDITMSTCIWDWVVTWFGKRIWQKYLISDFFNQEVYIRECCRRTTEAYICHSQMRYHLDLVKIIPSCMVIITW